MEIERKWLLSSLPSNIFPDSSYIIHQFYLNLNPEIRLRSCKALLDEEVKHPYRLAIKSDGTLERQEIQCDVTADFFYEALDFVGLTPIIKDYYIFYKDGFKIEISSVEETFIYAEVEFRTKEEAKSYDFPWPCLVIKEVTDDYEWKMKNYWKRTRLDIE